MFLHLICPICLLFLCFFNWLFQLWLQPCAFAEVMSCDPPHCTSRLSKAHMSDRQFSTASWIVLDLPLLTWCDWVLLETLRYLCSLTYKLEAAKSWPMQFLIRAQILTKFNIVCFGYGISITPCNETWNEYLYSVSFLQVCAWPGVCHVLTESMKSMNAMCNCACHVTCAPSSIAMEDLMKIALPLKYLSQNGDQEHMYLRMNDRHTFHTSVLLIGSTSTWLCTNQKNYTKPESLPQPSFIGGLRSNFHDFVFVFVSVIQILTNMCQTCMTNLKVW